MTIKEAKQKRIKERGKGNYSVYRHTSPSNKVYIGITSMKPEQRWGKYGQGYKTNNSFSNAIKNMDGIRSNMKFYLQILQRIRHLK